MRFIPYLRHLHRIPTERAQRLDSGEKGIFRMEHCLLVIEHAPALALGVHLAPSLIAAATAVVVLGIIIYAAATLASHLV